MVDALLRQVGAERRAELPSVSSVTLSRERLTQLRQVEVPGEANFFNEVCRRVSTDAERRASLIEEALHRGDLLAIENEAHSLRATTSAVGAIVLAELCGQVEEAARSGLIEDIRGLFGQLRWHVHDTQRILAVEIKANS